MIQFIARLTNKGFLKNFQVRSSLRDYKIYTLRSFRLFFPGRDAKGQIRIKSGVKFLFVLHVEVKKSQVASGLRLILIFKYPHQ